ncbi:MAG: hypothetical protein D6743_19840 [Calditrichaeota bacterium]|nr:MAG: hypothetical protein D6743_19840 [Calditrichota bacterium]
MLMTFPDQTNTRFAPGRRPRYLSELPEAERLLLSGISPRMWRVLDWLAMGGVMTGEQLAVHRRDLQRYAEKRLVKRLPIPPNEVYIELERLGWQFSGSQENVSIYALGDIGREIVSGRHRRPPLSGYEKYTLSRILHDVAVNEIVLRLAYLARERGWQVRWLGTNECELLDQKIQILEPDSLLILNHEEREIALAIEYHNEKGKTERARDKVIRYERTVDQEELWFSLWEVEQFPKVLVVFHDDVVVRGYLEEIRARGGTKAFYFGKRLSGLFDKQRLPLWRNIASRQVEEIIPQVRDRFGG